MNSSTGSSTPDVGSWIWLSFREEGRTTRREWAAHVTAHEKTRSSLSSADRPSFSVEYRNGSTESINATPYWRYIDGDTDPGADHPDYEDSRYQEAQRNLTDPEYQRRRRSGQMNWAAQWLAARAVDGCGAGSNFPVTIRGLTHRGEGTDREAFLSGRGPLDKAINERISASSNMSWTDQEQRDNNEEYPVMLHWYFFKYWQLLSLRRSLLNSRIVYLLKIVRIAASSTKAAAEERMRVFASPPLVSTATEAEVAELKQVHGKWAMYVAESKNEMPVLYNTIQKSIKEIAHQLGLLSRAAFKQAMVIRSVLPPPDGDRQAALDAAREEYATNPAFGPVSAFLAATAAPKELSPLYHKRLYNRMPSLLDLVANIGDATTPGVRSAMFLASEDASRLLRPEQERLASDFGLLFTKEKTEELADEKANATGSGGGELPLDPTKRPILFYSQFDNLEFYGSDRGAYRIWETTTGYRRYVYFEDLPVGVQEELRRRGPAAQSEVPPEHTGIESGADFQPTEEDDKKMRHVQLAMLAKFDRVASYEEACAYDPEQARREWEEERMEADEQGRGSPGDRRHLELTAGVKQYDVEHEDGAAKATVKARGSGSNGGALASAWNKRGQVIRPTMPLHENFAELTTQRKLVSDAVQGAPPGAAVAIGSDGGMGFPSLRALLESRKLFLRAADRGFDATGEGGGDTIDLTGDDDDDDDDDDDETLSDDELEHAAADCPEDEGSDDEQRRVSPEAKAAAAEQREARRNAKKKKPTTRDYHNAARVRFVIALWHTVQFAVEIVLKAFESEVTAFAAQWRHSLGRIKFLVTNGNLKRAMSELLSIAAGIAIFFLGLYRRHGEPKDGATYGDAEAWIESWCRTRPAASRLWHLREFTCMAIAMHACIRGRCWMHTRALHAALLALACVVGGDKYRLIIMAFLLDERSMSDEEMMAVIEAMFVNCGAMFDANDEFLELMQKWGRFHLRDYHNLQCLHRSEVVFPRMHEKSPGADVGTQPADPSLRGFGSTHVLRMEIVATVASACGRMFPSEGGVVYPLEVTMRGAYVASEVATEGSGAAAEEEADITGLPLSSAAQDLTQHGRAVVLIDAEESVLSEGGDFGRLGRLVSSSATRQKASESAVARAGARTDEAIAQAFGRGTSGLMRSLVAAYLAKEGDSSCHSKEEVAVSLTRGKKAKTWPVAIDDHGCIKATQRAAQKEGAPKTGDLAVKVGAVAVRADGVLQDGAIEKAREELAKAGTELAVTFRRLTDAEKPPPLLGDAKHAALLKAIRRWRKDSDTSATAALVDSEFDFNTNATATRAAEARIATAVEGEAPSFDRNAAARDALPAAFDPTLHTGLRWRAAEVARLDGLGANPLGLGAETTALDAMRALTQYLFEDQPAMACWPRPGSSTSAAARPTAMDGVAGEVLKGRANWAPWKQDRYGGWQGNARAAAAALGGGTQQLGGGRRAVVMAQSGWRKEREMMRALEERRRRAQAGATRTSPSRWDSEAPPPFWRKAFVRSCQKRVEKAEGKAEEEARAKAELLEQKARKKEEAAAEAARKAKEAEERKAAAVKKKAEQAAQKMAAAAKKKAEQAAQKQKKEDEKAAQKAKKAEEKEARKKEEEEAKEAARVAKEEANAARAKAAGARAEATTKKAAADKAKKERAKKAKAEASKAAAAAEDERQKRSKAIVTARSQNGRLRVQHNYSLLGSSGKPQEGGQENWINGT